MVYSKLNDASISIKCIEDTVGPKGGYSFPISYGIPISAFIVYNEDNVDLYNGIELIDWYISPESPNAYSFAIGYAPKDDFTKFDRIPHVTIRIYYIASK